MAREWDAAGRWVRVSLAGPRRRVTAGDDRYGQFGQGRRYRLGGTVKYGGKARIAGSGLLGDQIRMGARHRASPQG